MPGATVPTDPTELLDAWEAGAAAGGAQRTLLLHALACPSSSVDELLDVPVGARDVSLLRLRRTLFGPRLDMQVTCGSCGEELESTLDVDDLVGPATAGAPGAPAPPDAPPAPGGRRAGPELVEAGGWTVRFRLPTAGDLLAAAATATPDEARRIVLARTVLEASSSPGATATDPQPGLPRDVQAEVAAAMEAADPWADIRLDLPCPQCAHRTKAVLDIGPYLWAELDAWARGALLDVHLLASTYGWTEPDVLALTPLRRRHYLELAGHA